MSGEKAKPIGNIDFDKTEKTLYQLREHIKSCIFMNSGNLTIAWRELALHLHENGYKIIELNEQSKV